MLFKKLSTSSGVGEGAVKFFGLSLGNDSSDTTPCGAGAAGSADSAGAAVCAVGRLSCVFACPYTGAVATAAIIPIAIHIFTINHSPRISLVLFVSFFCSVA
jgi:hypothetical protein